jgi:hypothetical protein
MTVADRPRQGLRRSLVCPASKTLRPRCEPGPNWLWEKPAMAFFYDGET